MSLKSEKQAGKKVKKQKTNTKMSQIDLFDMEWYIEDEKNEIEINAPFLFQEIERELKSYLFDSVEKKVSSSR